MYSQLLRFQYLETIVPTKGNYNFQRRNYSFL